ncbi:MAG: S-layer homology domain-containing protein [Ruminococcaceae bacterium]|nr:S-layer homology domain-containing protein [Oscillospiraceae bacterium]
MKKLLVLFTLLSVLCGIVYATEPGYVFMPHDGFQYMEMVVSGDSDFTYTKGYGTLTVIKDIDDKNNGDPFVWLNTELNSEYEWIKFRIRNRSEATQFEFHFASPATDNAVAAQSCTHFPITSNDADFKEYVYNIKEANIASQSVNGVSLEESVWSGIISQLRFDGMWKAEPSGQMPKGSSMDFDYVAFFKTKQEADAYTGPQKISRDEMEWDKNSPHFIFDNEDEISKWSADGCSASLEGGNMKMVPGSWDPTLTRVMDEPFNTADYPFFAYRYKAFARGVNSGGLFIRTDSVPSFTGKAFTSWSLNTDDQWTDIIIDMREEPHGAWTTNLNAVRLDAINGQVQDMNAAVYVNRLGFFKTKEEAKIFLAHAKTDYSQTSSYSDAMFKAIIPGGVLSDKSGRSDFVLTSTQPEGTGTAAPVVMYTAKDGIKSIVALSNVAESGYITYVANKPGSYTMGYNHKDYVDIAGHWGENYINFVSDRALFGGTSPTEFSPDMTMTRGMFITVLGRMHGLDVSAYGTDTGYTDVNPNEYYAPYIKWAKTEGIMAGLSDTIFAPEEPITRATMAVVIKNYIDNSGFKFTAYSETEGFNDLDGLDEASVSAINTVKNVGIVGGKGEGRFDPHGISTRAEVATVMERVIKAVLGVNLPVGAKTHEQITRDRLRIGTWRFNSAFATPEGMKELRDLGVDLIVHGGATSGAGVARDTLLNYADVYGIEVYMQDYYTVITSNEENVNNFIAQSDPKITAAPYAHHPSFNGHFIIDEPGTDDFAALGKVIDDYESQMPGNRAFVNLLPMYANAAQLKYGAGAAAIEYYDSDPDLYKKHCELWFATNNTDYICTDIYPLLANKTYDEYVESINQIATVARDVGKEFWCCIQAHTWASSHRNPTEAEVRWQCYSLLSFGCTALLLWDYVGNANYPGIMNPATLEKTDNYYACQPVMWEMRELSDTYIQYKNVGAFTHNAIKKYQQMSNEYTGFDAIKSIESEESFLIGCFEKKDGSGAVAFTIVNMEELLKEAGAQAVITLDPAKKVTVYEKGKPTVVENDGTLELTFECGDGYFVTIE